MNSGFNLPLFLEILNGNVALLSLFLLPLIAAQIWRYRSQYRGLWRFLTDDPMGLQVVVAMGVYHLGDLLTRSAVWFARYMGVGGQMDFQYLFLLPLLAGSSLALVGLVCKIRVLSVGLFRTYRVYVTTAAFAAVFFTFWSLFNG